MKFAQEAAEMIAAMSLDARHEGDKRWYEQALKETISTCYRESHPVDTDLSVVRGKLEEAEERLKFSFPPNYNLSDVKEAMHMIREALALMEGRQV